MQNSTVVVTFSVLYRKHPFDKGRHNLRPCDLTVAETLKQTAVVRYVFCQER